MSHARLFALLAVGVTLLSSGHPAGAEEQAAPEHIDARSAYLVDSLLHGHQIHLRGTLGGKGSLHVNPNVCATNDFGDPTRCTRRAPIVHEVELKQVKLGDPKRLGRRLFDLVGPSLPAGVRVSLVMPGRVRVPPRLVLTNGNLRHIITLIASPARVPVAPQPPVQPKPPVKPQPPVPPMPGKAIFKAYQSGTIVTLEIRGSHPSAGYTTTLDRLPRTNGAPQYRLIHTPPKGPAATVITPYSLIRSFRSDKPLAAIRVTDGSGTHTIKVDQR